MSYILNVLNKKSIQVIAFLLFLILSTVASLNLFASYFLNKGANGDEYYRENIYTFSNIDFEKITYIPAQLYILLASFFNIFIDNTLVAPRVISLFMLLLILCYFIYKIVKLDGSRFDKIQYFLIIFFILCISRQPFIGTSDFMSYVLLIPFIIELNEYFFNDKKMTNIKVISLAFLLAASVFTRPTVIIIIISYTISLLFILRFNILKSKKVFLIPLASLFFVALFNFGPLKTEKKIILDVKEVPKELGTNWLERNYLMAKFWDEGVYPTTKWVTIKEAVQYKKDNPDAYIPNSNIDLLINEPFLYFKQMVRMFASANYTMLLYTNFLYLFAIYLLGVKFFPKSYNSTNYSITYLDKNTITVYLLSFYLSIIGFSFLAFKLFEFRWIIPIMIVIVWEILRLFSKIGGKQINIYRTIFYLFFILFIIKGYKIFLI